MPERHQLPPALVTRLETILPRTIFEAARDGTLPGRALSIRLNPLRGDPCETRRALEHAGHPLTPVPWCAEAFTTTSTIRALQDHPSHAEGQFHIQSLSSIAATIALDPRPGETVLDLCAAPGSKTSHIAARTGNSGHLVANDSSRTRLFRLKEVLRLLGATAECSCESGERFGRAHSRQFDRVLVDAPCSAEGRIVAGESKAAADWSIQKVRRLASLQKALLHSGLEALREGGTLVYSTCTFAPEENELVVERALERYGDQVDLIPIDTLDDLAVAPLGEWQGAAIDERVRHARRILPPNEGFFLAKFVRTRT